MKLQDFDFRIWDENYKGCNNKNCERQSNFIYGEEAKVRLSEFNNDVEIELWTGLYDKNGKKIYENDVLKFRFSFYNGTQEIIAYANAATYNGLFFTSKDVGLRPRIDDCSYRYLETEFNFTMEIIGNMHENPELLK
ncbi:hypothetical protein OH756_000641 [Campylobacter jejuni]|nr:hypothetical protein [Campylobacter jejuni]EAJ9213040.1 hypothetical protein [Campylobacter jejuni]EAL1179554.1 hypothetical protein [Campylobacter jejuni]EAL8928009.1 hypothetical protein [Campylobacter jejuni]EDK9190004.1 hypothetical protein [Campylobacter jejuni]